MASLEWSARRRAWRVRWRDAPGGRKRSTAWLDDRNAAADVLDQKQDIETGARRRSGDTPVLAVALLQWLHDGRVATVYRERTKRTLERAFARWGVQTFADLTPGTPTDLRAGERRLLRAFLRWADRRDMAFDRRCLHLPPAVRIRPAQPKAPLLTDQQVRALLAAAQAWSPANAVFAHMIATYGHRPQSLAVARVGDYDSKGQTLRLVVKGGDVIRHRLLPASARMVARLAAGRGPDEPLFINHLGRAWTSGEEFAVWWWPNIGRPTVGREQAGCYHLKRYAITRMMDRVDAATAASITGHRDPHTLDRYRRTNDHKQAAALAALADLPIPAPSRPPRRQK